MTDKVQKIKEWISKEQDGLIDEQGNFEYLEHEGAYHILCNLDAYIDSLHEEPVSDTQSPVIFYGLTGSVGSPKEESVSDNLDDYINELSKQFPEVSFAKLSRIAVRVSRWQRNQDTKHKLPEVKNRTDIDEYAYQCAYDMSNDWAIVNPTWHDVEDACKLGANWQKQQMMKDAIDLKINRDVLYDLKSIIHEKYQDYKIGDKVKVTIIKDE